MVYIRNRTWQISFELEKSAGYWPYQSKTRNYTLRILNFLSVFSFGVPLVIRIVKEWNVNSYIVLENTVVLGIIVIVIVRLIGASLTQNQRQQIVEEIALHIENIDDEEEAEILRNFSDEGLKFTIRYAGTLVIAFAFFDGLPVVRMCYFYFFENGKMEKKFPFYVDYLVDEQEYFFYLFAHLVGSIIGGAIIVFTYDLTFFLSVRHTCALFKIICLRLHKASEILDNNTSLESQNQAHGIMLSAIDLHSEAIQLAKWIDGAYNINWFIILMINMTALAPIPIIFLLYMYIPFELCRYLSAYLVVLAHFYAIYRHGQQMIDYSSSVFDACYDCNWYTVSNRSLTFMFIIIMTRSLKPCELTGGGMFILSMETYGKMMKTGLSYFSLIAAFEL